MEWWPFMMMAFSSIVLMMLLVFLCKRWCANCSRTAASPSPVVNTSQSTVVTTRGGPSAVRYGREGPEVITINTRHHINMAYTPPEVQAGGSHPAGVQFVPPPYAEKPPTYEELYSPATGRGAAFSTVSSDSPQGANQTNSRQAGGSDAAVNNL